MSGSSFPERWPAAGERAFGGYRLDTDGAFVPAPAEVGTVPAALGLRTTAADLIRFALGWSTLLPDPLAEEAMPPLVRPSASSAVAFGLGWRINQSRGVAGQAGYAPSAAAFAGPQAGQRQDPRRRDQPGYPDRGGQRARRPRARRPLTGAA